MRPSVVQERSYGSVRVFWLNKEELYKGLITAVRTLKKERPEVKEIILFGSVAEGRAVPGSDVDLLVITGKKTEEIERYFEDLELPVDLHIATPEEVEKSSFWREICKRGRKLQ